MKFLKPILLFIATLLSKWAGEMPTATAAPIEVESPPTATIPENVAPTPILVEEPVAMPDEMEQAPTPSSPTEQVWIDPPDFSRVVKPLLQVEAGYQDDVEDDGNFFRGQLMGTNMGITPSFYFKMTGELPTIEIIKGLTEEKVVAMYKKGKWDVLNLDNLYDHQMAAILHDGQVQHGANVRLIKQTLNAHFGYDFWTDRKISVDLLQALVDVSKADAERFFWYYKSVRTHYYATWWMPKHPEKIKYLRGWILRINEFVYLQPTTA